MGHAYYEQIEIGSVVENGGRTITETDLVLITSLTGMIDPVHLDHEEMKKSRFGERLVPGVFTMGVALGLIHAVRQGRTVGLVEISKLKFPNPVIPGDTITARSEITAKRESRSNPEVGLVHLHDTGRNQRGECVLELDRIVMYKRQPATAEQ